MKQPPVSLSPRLLEKLACPKCRGTLVYRHQEELLICRACGLEYTVRHGIPMLLLDEAKTIQ